MRPARLVACALGFLACLSSVAIARNPEIPSTTVELGLILPPTPQARLDCVVDISYPLDWEQLRSCLPHAASPKEKARGVLALPSEGNVTQLGTKQMRKLDAIAIVLGAHNRDEVYEIKIVDVRAARMGLHARSLLLISEKMLNLLSERELQAMTAHEIGHEYIWGEFDAARWSGDYCRLRQLELLCDAIAVATLEHLGIDHRYLVRAIEKVMRYNSIRFGVAGNQNEYPSFEERRQRIEGAVTAVYAR